MHTPKVLRYAAFTDHADGGNPAGVVMDAGDITENEMQEIARNVGYSETAFLAQTELGPSPCAISAPKSRFRSAGMPRSRLPWRFGAGQLLLNTAAGIIAIDTVSNSNRFTATLTSVTPKVENVTAIDLDRVLDALRWERRDMDPCLPVRISDAGARHLILGVGTRQRLAELDYDFAALKMLMEELELVTVNLVWRQDQITFHARNPFPVGR